MANTNIWGTGKQYISQITLPGSDGKSSATYLIKDSQARDQIEILLKRGIQFIKSTSAENTPEGVTWDNGGTAVTGTLKPSKDIYSVYLVKSEVSISGQDIFDEYICVNISGAAEAPVFAWETLGNTEINFKDLGAMAYADQAIGSVNVPTSASSTFTGTSHDYTSKSYTPAGKISGGGFTGSATTFTGKFTPSGTVTISSAGTGTHNYTPAGTLTTSSVTIDPNTTNIKTVTTTGSVEAGSAASFKRGTFNGGSFTRGIDQFKSSELTTSVVNETLTIGFTKGEFKQGKDSFTPATHGDDTFTANKPTTVVLPGIQDVNNVWTGYKTATAAAQTFKGTGVQLTAGFTGTEGNTSVTGIPLGSNAAITFAGTAANITTTVKPEGTVSTTLTDTSKQVIVSPNGKVKQ